MEPVYPQAAKTKHIQGSVALHVEVTKEGTVENALVKSGDPILASAATAAVKKWKYKPFLLDGKGVPFQTQVTLSFVLDGK